MVERKKPIAIPVSFPERRRVRYRCMRIKNGNDEVKDNLKEIIQSQFKEGMDWDGFIETWDIDKHNPFKVVRIKKRWQR